MCGRVQPFASAVRGCSLISTVFGSKKCGGEGGREGDWEERRRGGRGGWSRQSVAFATPEGERGERGKRGRRVLGDSMGDVVLGYPRPGSDAGEPGRGADCRYRHATRAPAAQGEWSIATNGALN